jgi:hypothetical protein
MKNYFEAKLKYEKVDQNGRERKVTETFLLEAVSFSDAEAVMTGHGETVCKGLFEVKNIKESNVDNVLNLDGDYAFKAKITTLAIDEENGREKRFVSWWLVFADDFYDAFRKIQIELESLVVPAQVESMAASPVIELIDAF